MSQQSDDLLLAMAMRFSRDISNHLLTKKYNEMSLLSLKNKLKKMSNKNNYLDAMAILTEIGQLHDFVIARNGGQVTKGFPTAKYQELMGEMAMLLGEIFPKDKKAAEQSPGVLTGKDPVGVKPSSVGDIYDNLAGEETVIDDDPLKLVVFDRLLCEQLIKIAEVAMEALSNTNLKITELQTPNEPIGLEEIGATIDDAKNEMEKLSTQTGDGKPGAIGNVQLLTRLMDIASAVTTLPMDTNERRQYVAFAKNVIGVAKKALLYTSAGLGMRVPE